MEPVRVRGSLRRHWVRRIRPCDSHGAHTATADPCFHAAHENIFAFLCYLRARAKLDLFATALAQFLGALRLFEGYTQEKSLRYLFYVW